MPTAPFTLTRLAAAVTVACPLLTTNAGAASFQDLVRCATNPSDPVCTTIGGSNVAARGAGSGSTFYWAGAGGNGAALNHLFEYGTDLIGSFIRVPRSDSNWSLTPGGVASPPPGYTDILRFTAGATSLYGNLVAGNTAGLSADEGGRWRVGGIRTEAFTPPITINAGNAPLSIGTAGIVKEGLSSLTFNTPLIVEGNQSWSIPTQFASIFVNSDFGGSATISFSAPDSTALFLYGDGTSFTGRLSATGGTVVLRGDGLRSGTLELSGSARVELEGSLSGRVAVLTGTGGTVLPGALSGVTEFIVGIDGVDAPDATFRGSLQDRGNQFGTFSRLSLRLAAAPSRRVLFLGTTGAATYTGATNIGSNAILAGGASNSFSARSNHVLATNGKLDLQGFNQAIGALSGSGRVYNFTNTPVTLTLAGTESATFTGTIESFPLFSGNPAGSLSLRKEGAGTQVIEGIHNWRGGSVTAGGTLLINGLHNTLEFLNPSSHQVLAGATFGGSGSVNQRVVVNTGGTLAPGGSGIGTFTVNTQFPGSRTQIAGTLAIQVNDNVLQRADRLEVPSNGFTSAVEILPGATLTVQATGPMQLPVYTILNGIITSGSFTNVTGLPAAYRLAANYGGTSNLSLVRDTDFDGIDDLIELAACSSELDADSDDDGIADGVEDANRNGVQDPGETSACAADSDNDGISDGIERGIINPVADPDGAGPAVGTSLAAFVADADPASSTNPLLADTDGDGFDDGIEDANRNGAVDAGESSPTDAASRPQVNVPLPLPATLGAAGLIAWLARRRLDGRHARERS